MPYIATKPATALLIVLWLLSPATAQQHDQAGPAHVAPDSAQLSSSDWYIDVTSTHLPVGATDALSMDAGVVDVDGDGDLDIIVANEHRANILLLNDGSGHFSDASDARLPRGEHDSEDIGIADFDGDGDPDIIVVSEDDQTNELYLNDGNGFFMDASDRLPVTGTSNAVVVADLVGDELPDILIGNNGQNVLLLNTGDATFKDITAGHLPQHDDVTQDLALGDVDGDGDPDLLIGNEDDNRVLLNDGHSRFVHAVAALPLRSAAEETRAADLADIDGDGDLDLLFGNVQAFVESADPQNRLLRNTGAGEFVDITTAQLPADQDRSFGAQFMDLDGDGDMDIITSNANRGKDEWITISPWRVYLNDGSGNFVDATAEIMPAITVGRGFDVEQADFNGDGLADLYLSSRDGSDRLLLRRASESPQKQALAAAQ